MWFGKKQSQRASEMRGRLAIGRRRPRTSRPRALEALEDRALMSTGGHHMPHTPHTSFTQTSLVSNVASLNPATVDPNLKNPWGVAFSPAGPFWVANNGTGTSTLYNGAGKAATGQNGMPLVFNVPPPAGSTATAAPTGIVFNSTSDFLVNGKPAAFIFDTEDGTISAWNPTTQSNAVLEVDHSNVPATGGAVYKALALASSGGANFLYATNFRAGTIDVFDGSFHQVALGSGAISGTFADPHVPHGYAPFGIASLDGFLVVTYAKQNSAKHDDTPGAGRGFVDVFDTSGHLLDRVASRGALNAPGGLAVAPSNFGTYSGDLLVGNFGDGRINAFQFPSGHSHKFQSAGPLKDAQGKPVVIDGLWSVVFGNGGKAGSTNTLFFSAGINGEQDGLFGSLTASM